MRLHAQASTKLGSMLHTLAQKLPGTDGSMHNKRSSTAQHAQQRSHLLHIGKAQLVNVAEHRHHQALGRGHRHRDVIVVAAGKKWHATQQEVGKLPWGS